MYTKIVKKTFLIFLILLFFVFIIHAIKTYPFKFLCSVLVSIVTYSTVAIVTYKIIEKKFQNNALMTKILNFILNIIWLWLLFSFLDFAYYKFVVKQSNVSQSILRDRNDTTGKLEKMNKGVEKLKWFITQ